MWNSFYSIIPQQVQKEIVMQVEFVLGLDIGHTKGNPSEEVFAAISCSCNYDRDVQDFAHSSLTITKFEAREFCSLSLTYTNTNLP